MKIDLFSAIVHFVFGAMFGALISVGILVAWWAVAEPSGTWLAAIVGSCVLFFGTLAARHQESFWEYLKDHLWWRAWF